MPHKVQTEAWSLQKTKKARKLRRQTSKADKELEAFQFDQGRLPIHLACDVMCGMSIPHVM